MKFYDNSRKKDDDKSKKKKRRVKPKHNYIVIEKWDKSEKEK